MHYITALDITVNIVQLLIFTVTKLRLLFYKKKYTNFSSIMKIPAGEKFAKILLRLMIGTITTKDW